MTPALLVVVGATAVGKSDLAVALAHAVGGQVVNADSMQLYRGMDIGTAKLTLAERGGVAHHLLDVWDVTQTASVAEYQRLAREVVDGLLADGVVPIVVGGSGLYIRALVEDLRFPGTDPAIRAELEVQAQELGSAALHARLQSLDPVAAQAILPTNTRRVVRALEVIELTGQPFTATLPGPTPVYSALQIGLRSPRDEVDQRIDARVERMWALGLVDEVRALLPQGLAGGVTASRALGYAQVLRHLADPNYSQEQAASDTAMETRRFARRQERWFRRDPTISWLTAGQPGLLDAALTVWKEAQPEVA